jgi:hypothetical protein
MGMTAGGVEHAARFMAGKRDTGSMRGRIFRAAHTCILFIRMNFWNCSSLSPVEVNVMKKRLGQR